MEELSVTYAICLKKNFFFKMLSRTNNSLFLLLCRKKCFLAFYL